MHSLILELLAVEHTHSVSTSYQEHARLGSRDYRTFDFTLDNPDISPQENTYLQVFGDRHAFMANLSILDALFNLGPSAKALIDWPGG